jgi:type II secretory ATPase GspE/PulE/Tfp pilus assembly ATPase PilB-like protein
MISLPKPLTSFIGRERELAQARRLLQDSYLVTLTGPGGSGKTQLCIALAACCWPATRRTSTPRPAGRA